MSGGGGPSQIPNYLPNGFPQSTTPTATNVCFDLSGFQYMGQVQKLQYLTAWDRFNTVQTYNSNVSTLRATGSYPNLMYYQFVTSQEKNVFTTGQFLHQQRYPNSNWNRVEQN
jgi:hypothetical protein